MTSPLLKLPLEIRQQIWELVLCLRFESLGKPRIPYADPRSAILMGRRTMTLRTRWWSFWPRSHVPVRRNSFTRLSSSHFLALLRCNKQIYHEAVSYFYSSNVFEFYGPPLRGFLRLGVPSRLLRYATSVYLHLGSVPNYAAALECHAMTMRIPNLRKLTIQSIWISEPVMMFQEGLWALSESIKVSQICPDYRQKVDPIDVFFRVKKDGTATWEHLSIEPWLDTYDGIIYSAIYE